MILQSFYPAIGGAEKQALELSRGLQARGIDVVVLTRRLKGLLPHENVFGVPIKRLWTWGRGVLNSFTFTMSSFVYLWRHIREIDVIHVHMASSHAIAAACVGTVFRKKVFVKLGGGNEVGEIFLSRKTFFGRLKLRVLGNLKPHLVLVSKNQAAELHGYGLEKVPVTVIPNGVDLKTFHSVSRDEKEAIRQKWGWTGLVFLFVGRYSPDKVRVDVFENFLTAWKNVVAEKSDHSFYLVGHGPLEESYRSIVERLGLKTSVHIGGPATDTTPLYQAADVFVLPSFSEGLSNALLEAMASGLPVLASRVPGIVDVVEEGVHGALFDPTSPREIEAALRRLSLSTEFGVMGSSCQKKSEDYSLDKTIQSYLQLYSSSCAA